MIALFDVTISAASGGVPVVDGLSLKMEQGQWHEVVGPAGVGKTTLFDVISLRRRPESGRLVVAGRNLERLSRNQLAEVRQQLGTCSQQPMLLGERTAVENVVLPMVVRGHTAGAVDDAEETLGFLGVMEQRDRRVKALCDQRKALVAVARATVGEPKVVIIDGIHERLEPAVRGVVLSWLEKIHEAGSTVIIFGRRPMNRASGSVLWRLRDGEIERTGEVERC